MTDLDDLEAVDQLDSRGFLAHLEGFPEQIEAGIRLGGSVRLPALSGIKAVAVLGMGGSGFSGDLLRAVMGPEAPAPVISIKGYDLPKWVGPSTLVFAVSYSGTTAETLQTLSEAQDRKATAVVIASGGPIAKEVTGSTPVVEVSGGLPPRAAVGYLFAPMLSICERLGLCTLGDSLSETVGMLESLREEYGKESVLEKNRAKQLAVELSGAIPVVYGSQGIGEPAAYRWKCQFNECSKVPSFWNVFPELDHNELEGWFGPEVSGALPLAVVALRDPADPPSLQAQIDLTLSMVEPRVGTVTKVVARGSSRLARLLDLVYLGDFTAAYLGLARGQDPGQITAIPELKQRMEDILARKHP